jgi:hypothetical protein
MPIANDNIKIDLHLGYMRAAVEVSEDIDLRELPRGFQLFGRIIREHRNARNEIIISIHPKDVHLLVAPEMISALIQASEIIS